MGAGEVGRCIVGLYMPEWIEADYGGFSKRIPSIYIKGAWDEMMDLWEEENMEWFMVALVNRLSPLSVREDKDEYWKVGTLKGLQIIHSIQD